MFCRFITSLGLISVTCLTAMPLMAALPDYHKVKDTAKEQYKYMIVVRTGSDWSPKSMEVARAAEEFAKGNDSIIWCVYDEKNNMTEEELKRPTPPGTIWNIPAVQVVTPDGYLVYKAEGVSVKGIASVAKKAEEAVTRQKKATELWNKADGMSGTEAAALYGQGLDLLPQYAASERKDILNKVKKADPKDTKGVNTRTTFHHLAYIEGIQRMVNDSAKDNGGKKDFKKAHELVNEKLATPGLDPLQKQKIMAARVWLYREAGEKEKALKTLLEIAKISPKTVLAEGARNYYKYLKEDVVLKKLHFDGNDVRPDLTPTRVKLTNVKEPGIYKIKFKVNRGWCSVQNARFVIGNKVVAQIPKNQQNKDRMDYELNLTTAGKPDLMFDARGHGWFDIDCDIIIEKK